MFRSMLSCCLVFLVSGSEFLEIEDAAFNGRIVGGTTALRGYFPFQVSLKTALIQSHFCGGFIITSRWIGTAAHCTHNRLPTNVIAVAGAVARTLEGEKIILEKFVTHPEYVNSNLRNDIALIKTEAAIEFTDVVQPIRLGAFYADNGVYAVASGWGYMTNPGQAAANLQHMEVEVVGLDECRKRLSPANAARVFNTSLCAQSNKSGGACMGDSGGPLIGPNGILIGLISWGVPCAKGQPDVYTRITSYHSWIDEVIDF